MYLTVLRPSKKEVSFEELLKNPFMTYTPDMENFYKKVTVEVNETYAQGLYNRTLGKDTSFPFPTKPLPYDRIKDNYRYYTIPKKSDPTKRRPIYAPSEELLLIQRIYNTYIKQHLKVQSHKAAHAYEPKRSIVTANKQHQKNESKWYLHIDLTDFFPSINETFLKNMLNEVYPFRFIPEERLEDIIQYGLHDLQRTEPGMPQGSALSPTLSNIVMVPIDYDITGKLHNYKKHHYVYTRYADDITISCKEKFDPKEIIKEIEFIFSMWGAPLRINPDKTRFGSVAGRNYHLGIIINKDNKLSAGHEKNNKFKAMLFNFCQIGEEWDIHEIQKMLGLISHYRSFEPDFVNKTIQKYNEKFNIDLLAKAKELIK